MICIRCLFDSTIPGIVFDKNGECSYCKLSDKLEKDYPINPKKLDNIVEQIKKNKKGKYDVVVGVSGGLDSSYMLLIAKEYGLNPLAVHYDNTYNTAVASQNMRRLLEHLDIDLETYVVDNKEIDNIYRAFIDAGSPDLEIPTDIGLAATLYNSCVKHNISYIFEGHSFRTEGVCPTGLNYMDSRYIQDVYNKFGCGIPLKSFPHMWLYKQLYWMCYRHIRKIRPLVYIDYNRDNAKNELYKYGWKDYGSYHNENHMTTFYCNYYMPKWFNISPHISNYSSLVRNGILSREQAIELIQKEKINSESFDIVSQRLNLKNSNIFCQKRTSDDFKNYKSTFRLLKPLFWLLSKNELVPRTFYEKYCNSSNS